MIRPKIIYSHTGANRRSHLLAVVFLFSVLYPLGLDFSGSIYLWAELFSPIIFGILLVVNMFKQRSMISDQNRIYYVAISVLIIWALLSWIRYPIFGTERSGWMGSDVGIKSYFRIFAAACIFFIGTWYARYYLAREYIVLIRLLLYFSLFIGILRLASFFFGFDIPFLYGVFRYNAEVSSQLGGVTVRFSGLDIAGYCGTFSLLSLRKSGKGPGLPVFVILFVIFSGFVILHAGRAAAYSYLFSLLYYGIFIEGIGIKRLLAFFSLVLILFIFLQFLPGAIVEGQLRRITSIEGGIQGQYANRRGYVFKAFMNEFYEHPVFGRGIKPVNIERADRNTEWIQQNLADGGHGSYHSLLGLFGLGGVFFVFIFLVLTIIKIHFIIGRPLLPNREVYVFIMLFFTYKLLHFYASGKGYNDYSLFLLAGVFVGIQSKVYGLVKMKQALE